MIAPQEIAMEVTGDTIIVVPQQASETETYAAKELSDYIFKINGVRLTVCTDETPQQEKEICLGDTNREPEGVEEPELYNDGYWLLNQDDKLFIAGDNDRGVLYGVYGLLEEVFGCRFYTALVEKVPQRTRLTVPDGLNLVRNPAFEFRDTNWPKEAIMANLAILLSGKAARLPTLATLSIPSTITCRWSGITKRTRSIFPWSMAFACGSRPNCA